MNGVQEDDLTNHKGAAVAAKCCLLTHTQVLVADVTGNDSRVLVCLTAGCLFNQSGFIGLLLENIGLRNLWSSTQFIIQIIVSLRL